MTNIASYKKLILVQIRQKNFLFLCTGDSMLPNIRSNESLRIIETKKVKQGDVVLYYTLQNERILLIAHRIQYIQGKYCICKGDNNFCFDPPLEIDQILGKVKTSNIQNQVREKQAKCVLEEWIVSLNN